MIRLLVAIGLVVLSTAASAQDRTGAAIDLCGPEEQTFPLQTNGVYPTAIFLCPGARVRFENQTGRMTALEYFDRNGDRAYTSILQGRGDTTAFFTFATRVELLYRNNDGYWYRTGRRSYLYERAAPDTY